MRKAKRCKWLRRLSARCPRVYAPGSMIGPCQLCARETALTRHHLVPQCRHHNKWNKKNFDRRAIKTDLLLLCSGCHRHLHVLFTEKELERRFHDLPSLRAHPEVEKFVAWLRTKPPGFKPPSSRAGTARLAWV